MRWHGRGDVRLDEVPFPDRAPAGTLLLETSWCGICGTDVEELANGPHNVPIGQPHPLTGATAPIGLGREVSGRVVEVGEAVSGFGVEDVVGVEATISFGECPSCRNGCPPLPAPGKRGP